MKRLILSLCAVAALSLSASTATAGSYGHHGHHAYHGPPARAYRGYGPGYYRHGPRHGYRRGYRRYAPAVRYYPVVPYYGPEFYPSYRSGFSYSSPGFSIYFGM